MQCVFASHVLTQPLLGRIQLYVCMCVLVYTRYRSMYVCVGIYSVQKYVCMCGYILGTEVCMYVWVYTRYRSMYVCVGIYSVQKYVCMGVWVYTRYRSERAIYS